MPYALLHCRWHGGAPVYEALDGLNRTTMAQAVESLAEVMGKAAGALEGRFNLRMASPLRSIAQIILRSGT